MGKQSFPVTGNIVHTRYNPATAQSPTGNIAGGNITFPPTMESENVRITFPPTMDASSYSCPKNAGDAALKAVSALIRLTFSENASFRADSYLKALVTKPLVSTENSGNAAEEEDDISDGFVLVSDDEGEAPSLVGDLAEQAVVVD